MKYLMYETTEFSTLTGGTSRFKEMYSYLDNLNLVDVLTQSGSLNEKDSVVKLDRNITTFLPWRFAITKITLSNKKIIRSINKKNYKKVFAYDVPSDIGLALLQTKHICLMIRKDLLDYKKLALQSQNAGKFKIFLWMLYLNICESICCLNAEDIIVQCEYDKRVLLNRHPFLKRRISKKTKTQINNVNPSWIIQKSAESLKEDDVRVKENTFNICCISGFGDKRKGADIILEAFSDISIPNVNLYMVGDGKELEYYKEKYIDQENIYFLGRLNNPTKILRQCDLSVVPSRADSCPNTVMEAIYNGVPVIGSNAGGIPEIINDKEALFEVDVNSLKDKIVQIIEKPKFRHEIMRRQSKRREELTFDWVEKILNLCS